MPGQEQFADRCREDFAPSGRTRGRRGWKPQRDGDIVAVGLLLLVNNRAAASDRERDECVAALHYAHTPRVRGRPKRFRRLGAVVNGA